LFTRSFQQAVEASEYAPDQELFKDLAARGVDPYFHMAKRIFGDVDITLELRARAKRYCYNLLYSGSPYEWF